MDWAFESITVHEKQPKDGPVLYDARGKPLVYRKPKLGFQPERIKKDAGSTR